MPSLHLHAPLNAVIRFGKKAGERLVPVKLGAQLTEVGTLEIWGDSKISEHRWRLQFELRKRRRQRRRSARPAAVVSEEALTARAGADRSGVLAFGEIARSRRRNCRPSWNRRSGWGAIRGRCRRSGSWPTRCWNWPTGARRAAAHEMRWLNLCGFCLRPGFGFPGDDFRIEQARRIYAAGLTFANQVQNEIDWWIFWGRVAGGLNRNQQTDIFQRLSPMLLPRGSKKPQRVNPRLLREMWRAAASLELLPLHTKTQLGDALMTRVKTGDFVDTGLWCLARLGARKLFYGPINQVIPPATVARWVEALLRIPTAGDALAAMARRTEDPTRDLPAATREAVRSKLQTLPHSDRLLAVLDGEEEDEGALGRIFGEELPSRSRAGGDGGAGVGGDSRGRLCCNRSNERNPGFRRRRPHCAERPACGGMGISVVPAHARRRRTGQLPDSSARRSRKCIPRRRGGDDQHTGGSGLHCSGCLRLYGEGVAAALIDAAGARRGSGAFCGCGPGYAARERERRDWPHLRGGQARRATRVRRQELLTGAGDLRDSLLPGDMRGGGRDRLFYHR